tara:strand:+ start:385 stop:651 length:267 start_codon:yes stop_codon:yes gene_type:complete
MEKQSKKIKIGDLVCYNAGGQKRKTLGLVVDIDDDQFKKIALIQWCCIGNGLLPRKASTSWKFGEPDPIIGPGSMVWHFVGDWFEVVK